MQRWNTFIQNYVETIAEALGDDDIINIGD